MGSKIFIIEDSLVDQKIYEKLLSSNHELRFDAGTPKVVESALYFDPDLVILDLFLPHTDGFKLFNQMRSHENLAEVPIFFVSASIEEQEKIMGLRLGAHDFIRKPFNLEELKLKIQNCLVRNQRYRDRESVMKEGPFEIHQAERKVYFHFPEGKQELEFGHIAFKVFVYLLKHVEQVRSRQQIMDAVWGPSVYVSERNVDAQLSALRRQLKSTGVQIEAVYGEGYRLKLGGLQKRAA